MGTAAQTVLSTPELLQAILLEVIRLEIPQSCNIVTAKRVNTFWRDVFAASPLIQQQLFYKEIPSPTKDQRVNTKFNPMLPNIFRRGYYVYSRRHEGLTPDIACTRTLGLNRAERARLRSRVTSLLNKPGSWKSMLVANPPCPTYFLERDGGNFIWCEVVEQTAEERLNELLRRIE